jgi:Cytochrome P460
MRVRLPLTAIALSAAASVSYFAHVSRAEEASKRSKRSNAHAAVTDEILASIRLGLREAAAPKPARDAKLVRVTSKPFFVATILCEGAPPDDLHDGFWIHVYVTQKGRDTMMSGKGVYPKGTIILKQKFKDEAGTKTALFTGMLKREKGYDPEVGDWEFFVLNSEATAVRQARNIQSCIDCHAPFRASDFVSRRYLTAKGAAGT